MGWQPSKLLISLSVVTLLIDEFETDVVFPSCSVLVEGRELLADLALLDVIDFNVIPRMDCWCNIMLLWVVGRRK